MPFRIVACTFPDNLSRNSYIVGVFDQLACQARRYLDSEMYSMFRFLGDDRVISGIQL